MEQPYVSEIFQDVEGLYGIVGAWHHRFQADNPDVFYSGGEIESDPVTGLPTQEALLIYVDVEPEQK